MTTELIDGMPTATKYPMSEATAQMTRVAGTQVGVAGTPATPWLLLLLVVDAVTFALAWALLPVLLEE